VLVPRGTADFSCTPIPENTNAHRSLLRLGLIPKPNANPIKMTQVTRKLLYVGKRYPRSGVPGNNPSACMPTRVEPPWSSMRESRGGILNCHSS
jgi:hypothetical protein